VSQTPIEQVVPLLRRAMKVLSDREVSPQLGLLKSTMLQLDSTFSERTFGVSSFRDFAEKLAGAGFVTLKESGRNVLVEMKEDAQGGSSQHQQPAQPQQFQHDQHSQPPQDQPSPPAPHQQQAQRQPNAPHPPQGQPRVEDAVAEVRRLFQAAQQPPRWPMYLRQVKQYLRGVDQTFDERKFGFHSLNDLLRACQREGLFRIERDRQGVIRFFQGNVMKADEVAAAHGINRADIEAAERLAQAAEAELAAAEARQDVVDGDVVREQETPSIVDVEAQAVEVDTAPPEPAGEPPKPSRRKRAPKPAPEKKASKPRGSRRKVAVAADA
jgi:hypothetical protein